MKIFYYLMVLGAAKHRDNNKLRKKHKHSELF